MEEKTSLKQIEKEMKKLGYKGEALEKVLNDAVALECRLAEISEKEKKEKARKNAESVFADLLLHADLTELAQEAAGIAVDEILEKEKEK